MVGRWRRGSPERRFRGAAVGPGGGRAREESARQSGGDHRVGGPAMKPHAVTGPAWTVRRRCAWTGGVTNRPASGVPGAAWVVRCIGDRVPLGVGRAGRGSRERAGREKGEARRAPQDVTVSMDQRAAATPPQAPM
ncbi:hypothetical protein GCM10018791_62530 [Streptomyces zaomyceticus]|nr:hypothetical protein GCM10018791_62530 [Streptomyces zaomyceticus]